MRFWYQHPLATPSGMFVLMFYVPVNNLSAMSGHISFLSRVAQSVTCATTDPVVTSSILAWSHTFAEIDRDIISTAILLTSADSRRVAVSYKGKYVHKVLYNCIVKHSQEKVWLGELTVQT